MAKIVLMHEKMKTQIVTDMCEHFKQGLS